MDEDDLVKAGMEVVLRPVTEIAENALGVLGGDYLAELRARQRARLRKRTEEILKQRQVEEPASVSPNDLMPLLASAQNETGDELTELWAKLLAALMDPKRKAAYRREFVDIAKDLEPVDAIVLQKLSGVGRLSPSRQKYLSTTLNVSEDFVQNAFRNLTRLQMVEVLAGHTWEEAPSLTALGRQFLTAIQD